MADNIENNLGGADSDAGNNAGEVVNFDLELMRGFDGESTELSSTELSKMVPQAALKLEALTELGDGLRLLIDSEIRERIEDDTFSSMWGRIEQQIAGGVDAVQALPHPTEQPGGIFNAIRAWFERYRSQVLTGMVSAAAAATLVWFVRPSSTEVRLVDVDTSSTQATPSEPLLVSAPPEVESLEVYDGSGIILTLPADGDGGAPTSVIWLLSPEKSEEGPI